MGDAARPTSGNNGVVGEAADRRAPAPAAVGVLLGLSAVGELLLRLRVDDATLTRLTLTGSVLRTAGGGVRAQYLLVLTVLCLAATLPVSLLRPTPAAGVVLGAGLVSLAGFQLLTVAALAGQLLAAYRIGRGGDSAAARVLVVVLGLAFLPVALHPPDGDATIRVLAVLLAALVPAAAAAGIAEHAAGQERESRAARQLMAGRFEQHTARAERARIARDLHDVVAHHLSMISVQAETARLTTPGLPPEGARQLRAIGDTARSSLTEMRRLLGVLREDVEPATPDDDAGPARPAADLVRPDRHPQPGLAQLNGLVDSAREVAGAGVRLIVRGPPTELDPGVELTVYRIVQESLTNARRHAPGAAVDVELRYTEAALHLRIRDNGPGPGVDPDPARLGEDPGPTGHGLLGMRERTAAVGGEVRIGPAAGGGLLIEARLPTRTRDEP